MKLPAFQMLIAATFLSVFCSCVNKFLDSEAKVIDMNRGVTGLKVSDLVSVQGFTVLEQNNEIDWRGITKMLFKEDGTVVILNYVGDKQDVWLVDQNTGKALLKVGAQNNEEEGYEGLNDIILDQGDIRFCVAGKMAFKNYDFGGNFRSSIKSGIFGEEMEKTPSGEYVVYNEFNSTKISGLNHLIFYDKKGNISKRIYPYLSSQDGNGYDFAGSLTTSNGLWFNPPFCDTVFEIIGYKLQPRYYFDFGQNNMPEQIRQKKLTGWDTQKFSFLSRGFAKIGKFIVFEYYENQKIKLGMFDEMTEQFISFNDAEPDFMLELMRLGDIFPKAQQSFALQIRPSRIKYLLNKNLLDLNALDLNNPGLGASLKNAAQNNVPLIVYISIKPNAQIAKI